MANETLGSSSSFSMSRQDVNKLKQTATDAASDLSSTAAVHASKAQGQLKELAGHVREEGGAHVNQLKGQFEDVVDSAREYVSSRPFTVVGVAFAIGFLLGLTRTGSSDD